MADVQICGQDVMTAIALRLREAESNLRAATAPPAARDCLSAAETHLVEALTLLQAARLFDAL